MKNKQLTPNRNNIETYLPIFSGFYGADYEGDFYGEAEHYGLPSNFDFAAFFDYSKYHADLSKYFCDCVESQMSDFIERIDFQYLHSPKYYNYENDSIYCIIRPKKQAIKDYILTNKDAFCTYLRDNLTSRSGFISHHSNNFNDWFEMTKGFTRYDKEYSSSGFHLGFILSFIAANEGLNELDVFSDYNANVYVSEYLNEDFYNMVDQLECSPFINKSVFIEAKQSGELTVNVSEQIEAIKSFVRNNYMNPTVKELAIAEFSDIDAGFYTILSNILNIEAIITHQIKEIEERTLPLIL